MGWRWFLVARLYILALLMAAMGFVGCLVGSGLLGFVGF